VSDAASLPLAKVGTVGYELPGAAPSPTHTSCAVRDTRHTFPECGYGKSGRDTVKRYDIIVVAASREDPSSLKTLISAWPADLPASVFVVMHVGT